MCERLKSSLLKCVLERGENCDPTPNVLMVASLNSRPKQYNSSTDFEVAVIFAFA